ncbi:MAG: DNA polymerase III, subunit gamma and tau [Parcubacteria group bacterium Gr01-1014_8]|nr:MAG: DNA polymerase III, subunit gamma and tau [Parcubacteria group bacterium Gr01-1014_8]
MTAKTETKHTTLYRAYRPRTFGETHGQEHIVKVLEAEIKQKKPAHAYLFVGSRGTGKTTFARILARELGVTDKDLYEMDAASHTGVENIRELREGANVMPFESPYKFYIIDEAHMLSKGAWNAFLKTLEEPPPHVIFVLATTDRDKVPDTIQSRCEIYSFKQPTREVLAQVVSDVAKKEGYSLESSASELVALLAEGSFRDALSILQKVLAVSKDPSETGKLSHGAGKKVTVAEVEEVSGAPRGELVRRLLKGLSEKNAKDSLSAIQEAVDENLDARTLAKLLIHRMRVVLLLRYAPDLAGSFSKELTDADLALAKEISKNPGVTSETLRMLLEAYGAMAYAAVQHLPLELSVIDICGRE